MSDAARRLLLGDRESLRQFSGRAKQAGSRVVLVPTMGDLHEGHLELVRLGSQLGPVIVSIFVNPTQFGPAEDFDSYPRELDSDLRKLVELDLPVVVYAPENLDLYDPDASTWVEVAKLGDSLCGRHRAGHFRGVTTVLAKLFGLVQPDVAVFGQKDAQQCLIVQRMVRDLRLPIQLLFGATVRESDGLAMSSRNRYLSQEDRVSATSLHRALCVAGDLLRGGERASDRIEERMKQELNSVEIDYAEARSLPALLHPEILRGRVLLAVAANVGRARLIDNICFELEDGVREAPLSDGSTLDALRATL